jgi:flavin-dependent dehydrogenase
VYWADSAEAYVTPVAADLVGVAVLCPGGRPYQAWLEDFPALRERLDGAEPASEVRGAGPLRQDVTARVRGRTLLVGDAAGYVDALTGEGISMGLTCARELVAALVADRPQDYDAAWRRTTRRYRILTGGLLSVAGRPTLRRGIVPAARALPGAFAAIVNQLG